MTLMTQDSKERQAISSVPQFFGSFASVTLRNAIIMTEEEINKYRLTSMEEPTDEMLAYIMREAAEEAREKREIAMRKFWNEIAEMRKKMEDSCKNYVNE